MQQLAERAWNEEGPTGSIKAVMLTSAGIPAATAIGVQGEEVSESADAKLQTTEIRLASYSDEDCRKVAELVHFLITTEDFSPYRDVFLTRNPVKGLSQIHADGGHGLPDESQMCDAFVWLCLRPGRRPELNVLKLGGILKVAEEPELRGKWSMGFGIKSYKCRGPIFREWVAKVEHALSDAQRNSLDLWEKKNKLCPS
jgi:hypothetical protein